MYTFIVKTAQGFEVRVAEKVSTFATLFTEAEATKVKALIDGPVTTKKVAPKLKGATAVRRIAAATQVDPEAPYGRKKDGTPKARPGRPIPPVASAPQAGTVTDIAARSDRKVLAATPATLGGTPVDEEKLRTMVAAGA